MRFFDGADRVVHRRHDCRGSDLSERIVHYQQQLQARSRRVEVQTHGVPDELAEPLRTRNHLNHKGHKDHKDRRGSRFDGVGDLCGLCDLCGSHDWRLEQPGGSGGSAHESTFVHRLRHHRHGGRLLRGFARPRVRSRLAASAGAAAPTTVQTTSGKVRGLVQNNVHTFKGVPYGASTAGAGRFMPPGKLQPWTGVRDAIELGPRAPQIFGGEPPEVAATDPREALGEDCLCLNVWTPKPGGGQRRPVMVWLHGGGFTSGSGSYSMYDGTELARKHDVVAISVNHRLNVFGFLYLAEIGGGKYRQRQQRRHARHRRRARVGARQHRGVRRRSEQRDDLRPVGRRRQGQHADGDAGGQGAVPSRDRAKRRGVCAALAGRCDQDRRNGADAARSRSQPPRRAAEGADGSAPRRHATARGPAVV